MQQIDEMGDFILSFSPKIIQMLKDGYWSIAQTEQIDGRPDVSTNLDHEIGEFIGSAILEKWPDVGIDTEEVEERRIGHDITVRIDPLDGSKNALSGIDLIATTLSVNYQNEPYFGLVINPFSEKVYHAFKGRGAFLNKKRIHVNNAPISESFVMHEQPLAKMHRENPHQFDGYVKNLDALMKVSYRLRNVGLACVSVGWVAEGAACAFVDFSGSTKLYDIEASILIAREAGAVIGTFDGKVIDTLTYNPASEKKHISENLIIANPKAFAEITALLQSSL